MAHWDYQRDGGVYTKLTESAVARLVRDGELTGDSPIRRADEIEWQPLASHPLWQGPKTAERRSIEIPEMDSLKLLPVFTIWFFLTLFGIYLAWKEADSYNPQGNGMFNVAEATIMNSGWLKLIASILGSVVSAAAFSIWIIAARIKQLGDLNRRAALAIIEELRQAR